ncbi:MAG: hypothetical protein K6B46_06785 [Opitutales bacterium]|nr:hypothetical protein [Opitutales bacterium]
MKKLFLILISLLPALSTFAQEFHEDKFALTYYNLNYDPQGNPTEPYFVITKVDQPTEKVSPVRHLHREGKPGAYNFGKFKNKWKKGKTFYFENNDIKLDVPKLLSISPGERQNKLLFVFSGVFTVKETGFYRFEYQKFYEIIGLGEAPTTLRTSFCWHDRDGHPYFTPPTGKNTDKVPFEPQTYAEQWQRYGGHWTKLVAGTKYYFVAIHPHLPQNFSLKLIKHPKNEKISITPFSQK